MNWTVSKATDITTDIKIQYNQRSDWEQWWLITADEHVDNPHFKEKLYKHHMDQAVERNAFVTSIGDFIDGMQGRNDKRHTKGDTREELKTDAYLNDLSDYGVNLLAPYKDNMALLVKGNHETGLQKHTEYDVNREIRKSLALLGSPVQGGNYRGWLRLRFEHEAGGSRRTLKCYYTHGYGGGGPVTKGVIQANRKAVYLRDADIVLSGHVHEQWMFPIEQAGITASGEEIAYTQTHLMIPTYKEEFLNIGEGFHHQKGGPPKPVGCWWVRFYYSSRTGNIEYECIKGER